jgi:hypothetical protein
MQDTCEEKFPDARDRDAAASPLTPPSSHFEMIRKR